MTKSPTDAIPEKTIDGIISRHRGKCGELLAVLEEIQGLTRHKYLSRSTLSYISKKMKIPRSRLFSFVTFYTFFNLKPQGEHSIVVCRGTACHTRRSKILLEFLEDLLGLEETELKSGEKFFLTTPDKKFTLKTVACFGQCALAPVIEVDGAIYGHMNEQKLKKIIGEIKK